MSSKYFLRLNFIAICKIISILLLTTLSLRQNCLTSKLWNVSRWSQGKKSRIKSIHSTNVNPRTFWANKGLVITAGINTVGFVSGWKQRKRGCVAGTIPKFQKKIIKGFFCVCACVYSGFLKSMETEEEFVLQGQFRNSRRKL